MEVSFFITIFLIGFIGSMISGMVGVGGSIIKYPMLLYIPPALGFVAFSAHEVSGISAIQVFFATLAAVWAYKGSGYLHRSLILYMGSSVLVGSLIGAYGSIYLPEDGINVVYGLLALIAAIMMFLPKKNNENLIAKEVHFNKAVAMVSAFLVGVASGIVGAAGSFLLLPVLLVILKVPTRVAIATSLAVTFISSIGSTLGKVVTDQVLYGPAVIMIIASIIAAPIGAKIGQRMNTKLLQIALAVLILATAVQIWMDIFF
ncbi:membrane protein (plasmid) [Bacillaceae bacterium JMAK1]|nr:membrane protein [Bacillaceae bacterium JMAK1]